jgi:hypothetical protein
MIAWLMVLWLAIATQPLKRVSNYTSLSWKQMKIETSKYSFYWIHTNAYVHHHKIKKWSWQSSSSSKSACLASVKSWVQTQVLQKKKGLALIVHAYNSSYSDMRKIMVGSQPRQIVHETLSWKKSTKRKKPTKPSIKRDNGVAQDIGPEFKPQ